MGYSADDQKILVAQMLNFKENKVPMRHLLPKNTVLRRVHGGCLVKINLLSPGI
jgi:hypothetical protein